MTVDRHMRGGTQPRAIDKRHRSRPIGSRRHRRDLTGAAARGDRVAHLVGTPQRDRDRRGDQVDDLGRQPPTCARAGRRHRLGPQACARHTACGTRRSASGMRAAPSASATAHSSTGIRSRRSGRPSVATAGATSATLVVHDTIPPSPSSTIDSAVIRRKFSSPPSPTSVPSRRG